jgi:hypothetical protein
MAGARSSSRRSFAERGWTVSAAALTVIDRGEFDHLHTDPAQPMGFDRRIVDQEGGMVKGLAVGRQTRARCLCRSSRVVRSKSMLVELGAGAIGREDSVSYPLYLDDFPVGDDHAEATAPLLYGFAKVVHYHPDMTHSDQDDLLLMPKEDTRTGALGVPPAKESNTTLNYGEMWLVKARDDRLM